MWHKMTDSLGDKTTRLKSPWLLLNFCLFEKGKEQKRRNRDKMAPSDSGKLPVIPFLLSHCCLCSHSVAWTPHKGMTDEYKSGDGDFSRENRCCVVLVMSVVVCTMWCLGFDVSVGGVWKKVQKKGDVMLTKSFTGECCGLSLFNKRVSNVKEDKVVGACGYTLM